MQGGPVAGRRRAWRIPLSSAAPPAPAPPRPRPRSGPPMSHPQACRARKPALARVKLVNMGVHGGPALQPAHSNQGAGPKATPRCVRAKACCRAAAARARPAVGRRSTRCPRASVVRGSPSVKSSHLGRASWLAHEHAEALHLRCRHLLLELCGQPSSFAEPELKRALWTPSLQQARSALPSHHHPRHLSLPVPVPARRGGFCREGQTS